MSEATALRSGYQLVIAEGTPLFASDEVCACGSQCLACPLCGGIRCLHCDALEVEHPEGECCE